MMDQNEVDGKRKMIQVLMGVLKKSAGDEVANGIGGSSQHKELTHTPVPSGSVADHPHKKETFKAGAPTAHEPKADLASTEPSLASQVMPGMKDGGIVDLTKDQSLMEPTSEDMKMADGGMPSPSDEPEEVMTAEGKDEAPKPVEVERGDNAVEHYDTEDEENDTEKNEEMHGHDYTEDPFSVLMGSKKKKY